uniref:ARAD1B17050p n=1 Tax=Blastobotrys adeninivorans TaxID=409370 RepID=A0A060TCK2_BLAAD
MPEAPELQQLTPQLSSEYIESSSAVPESSNSQNGFAVRDVGQSHHPLVGTLLPEVLIEIFSQLPPGELDACSLVCRHWHDVLVDDASWRGSFERMFSVREFTRVSQSVKWRTELLSRLDYVHKWRKGTAKNISFNGQVSRISHVFPDFAHSRAVLFAQSIGAGVVADPTKGKLANPRLYTDKSLQVTSDVVSVDGSRFGMLYGMVDGAVRTILFSQDTRIHDYVVMKQRHETAVTTVWINHHESPRQNNTDTRQFFGALTGDMNGNILSWDLEEGELMRSYSTGDSSPVVHITCDHRRDCVLVAQASGAVSALFGLDKEFVSLGTVKTPIGPSRNHVSLFQADFVSGFVLYANSDVICRISIVDSPEKSRAQYYNFEGHVTAVAMDSTMSQQSGIINRDVPGKNARYFAAATSTEHVYVWKLQQEPNDFGEIRPLRVTMSPFQVDSPGLHGVTALALNSLVLLLGSYNGVTIAYELLTGEYLRIVSSRFSKRALNLRTMGHPDQTETGLVPITALEIDDNAANPHGIIIVGSAVQYFDFGADLETSGVKKRGVKKKRRGPHFTYDSNDVSRSELNREIEKDIELMGIEDEEVRELRQHNERMDELFGAEGLSEEDQVQYALMLSQDAHKGRQTQQVALDEDEEVNRAIQMSLENSSDSYHSSPNELGNADDEDEELKRAIELSLADAPAEDTLDDEPTSSRSAETAAIKRELTQLRPGDPDYDEDLDFALRLSLAEAESQNY